MGRVRAEYWAIFWLVYVHLLFFRHSGPFLCPLGKSVGFFKPGTFLSEVIRTQPRSPVVRVGRCVLGWCVLHRPYSCYVRLGEGRVSEEMVLQTRRAQTKPNKTDRGGKRRLQTENE